MSYAAIMVHFDAGPSAHRRLHLAVDLANRFQAALIGIAGKSYLPTFVSGGLAAGEGAGGVRQEMMDILADIGAEFRASAKHAKDVEWRGGAEPANDLVSNAARAADLVIIGQELEFDDELHYKLDPGIVMLVLDARSWLYRMTSICLRRSVSCWLGRIPGSPAARFVTHSRF